LVVIAAATDSTISSSIKGDPLEPPPSTTKFTRHPLEDGKVIAVVTYERPYLQPDPNLYFIPDLVFGERNPRVARDPFRIVFGDFFYLVRDQVIPQFERFFPAAP
jgi:hypothetical protein